MRTVIRIIADWVNTRYTRKGKLLLISLAFSSFLSLDPYNNNSYYIACLCFIFLAIAHVGAYFQNIPVKLKRDNLKPFNCDEEGHYYITISNLGEEALEDLKILDEYKLVHPDDMLAEVAVNAEALEQSFTRNKHSTKTSVPALLPKRKSKIKISLHPKSRGIMNFDRTSVLRPELMGLCYSIIQIKLNSSTLVRPKLLPIVDLQNRVPESHSFVKKNLPRQSVSFGELKGLKPYEIGDNLKRVHWKTFIRNNALVIKEFEKEQTKYYFFFIDNNKNLQRAVIEESVSVVWSLVYHFLHDSVARVKFYYSGGTFLPQQGNSNIEKIGNFLSLLKSGTDNPITRNSSSLKVELIEPQIVLIAMSATDEKRLESLKFIKKMFSGKELILIRNRFAVFPSTSLDREKIKEWRFK